MSVVFLKISSLTDKTTSDAMRMPWLAKSCPFCHEKGELRKVIWGLPDKEPDESSYEIGGCMPEPHNYVCISCGWKGDI